MTTFLLIRHAANDWIGRTLAGWLPEVHLNPVGYSQAAQLPQRLAGRRIDHIFCSPLERACETAGPLAAALGIQIEKHEALGEVRFGDWTGRNIPELETERDWQRYNAFRSCTRAPNGELMLEIQARVVAQILQWRSEFPNRTLAVVSHADVIKAGLTYFLGMPIDFVHRLEISPASVSTLTLSEDHVQVLAINQT